MDGYYDILFVVNLIILSGLIAYHFVKRQNKSVVINVITLLLFVLLKAVQANYVAVRAGIYDLLGPERFNSFRKVLNIVLFFSSSVMVGIELLIEIISLVLFICVTARVAVMLVKCRQAGKPFISFILPKPVKPRRIVIQTVPCLYLVWGRLLI